MSASYIFNYYSYCFYYIFGSGVEKQEDIGRQCEQVDAFKGRRKANCKDDVFVITLIAVLLFAPPSVMCWLLYDTGSMLVFISYLPFKLTFRVD